MDKKEIFSVAIAGAATFFTYIFGSWDVSLQVLIAFMILDYVTGVISGIVQKNLSSAIGFNGLLRKFTIIIVLIVAVLLDRLINQGTCVFRTIACYFYIANEGISILENVGRLGLPLPEKLIEILSQLKEGNKKDLYKRK